MLLVVSIGAALVGLWLDRTGSAGLKLLNEPRATLAELLCFGTVGAVLIARRPDLPFGWLLGIGAMTNAAVVCIGVPSLALVADGRGGELAAWGIYLGVLQWVPAALVGIINVRFPSGRPSTAVGVWLDRALRYGIVITVIATYLGDSVGRDAQDQLSGIDTSRAIDGTWITPVGNAAIALIPILILLAVLAGIGVIIRYFKATGVVRQQLRWRAGGAALALTLFPLAVAGVLPSAAYVADPLILVTTLMIPVLRYQLWSGAPEQRRRKVGRVVSRRTLIEMHEEERRRLRRELHDGLGPLVTGLRLNLDAAQAQMDTDPDKASQYLTNARQASAEVISDLRGLVEGLRPPALDEVGLTGALRTQLGSFAGNSDLNLSLELDETLALPAAVEVAVYRTACEAVTNVVRHSRARHCTVSLAADPQAAEVQLRIDDDGPVTDTWYAGVGLTSMRERATELGGTFLASSGPDGFHITASYPRSPS